MITGLRRSLSGVLLCLLFFLQGWAQRPVEWNASQIRLHLEKLDILGRVLYVAAHPDDENTRLLAYLANGALYRTAYLSCTRGDGGQNLLGDEQGSLLGLIRTQELLAARRIDGAEQYFTRANDFGFSKTATETLKFWGRERILGDMVWIIRKFRPDVIICRFPEDSRAGHGHHWASAILAHEAYFAAADSTRFPSQLKYVRPWQAKRILWNTYSFGRMNTTSPDQFHFDDAGYNPLLGESYGELAADSRSMHKSQGFGVPRTRGTAQEYFKTIAGSPPVHGLLDGVQTSWDRVAGGSVLGREVRQAIDHFDSDHPDRSVPALLRIYAAIQHIPDAYWKKEKSLEVIRLITQCCGLYLEADASQEAVVPGQPYSIRSILVNRSPVPVRIEKILYPGDSLVLNQALGNDTPLNERMSLSLADSAPISQPYWLEQDHPVGYYEIPSQLLVGRPQNIPPVRLTYVLNIAGEQIRIIRPAIFRHTDPVLGEIYDPLVIAPALTINLENEVYIYSSEQTREIRFTLRSFRDQVSGTLHLQAPAGFRVVDNDQPFRLDRSGQQQVLSFRVSLDRKVTISSSRYLTATARVDGNSYDRGYRVIRYAHIPSITVFPKSRARMVSLNLKTAGRRIGYIMGAGDMVPQALQQCGYQLTLLNEAAVMNGDLSGFDAIVCGIRAYNVDHWLEQAQPLLLNYVKNGGTLVLQYNKSNDYLIQAPLGPYPFHLTYDRVTEEDAPVKFLYPAAQIMNTPNKITENDFSGWIQERGLYFLGGVDPRYKKIFEMHDTGSPPLKGSTLVTRYGKGKYVYTCLDFFRELPAGVPGAFRIFANFLAPESRP